MIGTRYHQDDLYARILDENEQHQLRVWPEPEPGTCSANTRQPSPPPSEAYLEWRALVRRMEERFGWVERELTAEDLYDESDD